MAKTAAQYSKDYRERQRAKKLSGSAVARSDKGREKAEAVQGRQGPGRSDAPPAKTVDEAIARVKKPAAEAAAAEAAAPREVRPPTVREVEMVRRFMEMSNAPLVEMERDLETMGIVGETCPPALAKKGTIPASDKDLAFMSECTAGTLVNFAPSFMAYMYPIGMVLGGLGFIGSRLVIFWRINEAMKAEEKKARQAEENAKRPGHAGHMSANGANVSPMPSASQTTPGRN